MAPQVRSRCLHLSGGGSDISAVYILRRNHHLRPTLATSRWSPRRRAHVIIIPRNICRVEKDCHNRKYTGFALGAAKGSTSTNSSSWLGARSVKQRQTASPSKDGAADKDLSVVHFNGTDGGRGGREIKRFWEEVQERGPRKTPTGQTASPNQTCSTIAGCPERNLENGADSSSELLPKPLPPPPSLHPPKKSKTFLREPFCLAEAQTEPRWHSPMLMILGIRIYKVTGWQESFHQGRIL